MNALQLFRPGCSYLLITLLLIAQISFGQVTFNVNRKRPPVLNIAAYQKIAVGDIVGSAGRTTERSLDLTDALTSQLFNANAQEIIDRNALETLLASQKTALKTIDEKSVIALSKKLSSAIIIIGRIQNEKIYTAEKSVRNIIVVNGCNYGYWWEITGDITVQIKIMDVKTGKLLFSNPVTRKILVTTKHECQPYKLGDTEPLLKETIIELATEISKLIIPYDEPVSVTFDKPLLSIFKNPFKKLNAAITSFSNGNYDTGVEILKSYADDKSLKKETAIMAAYNYGAGLFIAERYDLAKEQLKIAAAMGSVSASSLMPKVEAEIKYKAILSAKKP